jgi:hypothetical protein
LAYLPVSIGEGSAQRSLDQGPIEGSEGENGPAADGRDVVGGGQDGVEPELKRPEGGNGRFTGQGIVVVAGLVGQRFGDSGAVLGAECQFTESEGGHLGQGVVVERMQEPIDERCRYRVGGQGWRQLDSSIPHLDRRVVEKGGELVGVEKTQSVGGT